ncbi:hypothetical protein GCM10010149_50170 [Nonomuraea roseoviolacea subsp. roseoviolacea]
MAVSAVRWSDTVTVPIVPLMLPPGVPVPTLTGPSGTVICRPAPELTVKSTVVEHVVDAAQVSARAGCAATVVTVTTAAAAHRAP